jgi:hypothetical protein
LVFEFDAQEIEPNRGAPHVGGIEHANEQHAI